MNKIYKQDQIEEVFQVLKDPQKLWFDFSQKYENDQPMLDLYEELRIYKEAGMKLEELDAPNVGLEWQKANFKLQKQSRLRTVCWTAAGILVLLSATLAYQFDNILGVNGIIENQLAQIEKGNSKAVLITSEGKSYRLEEGVEKVIEDQSGVRILADSNNVVQYAGALSNKEQADLNDMYNTLRVPRLGEYQLLLSDGTKVWLNSESELKYPVKFNGEQRVVELIGEAYFDVKSNPDMPFVVKTSKVDTRVLGTEFNVSAYPEEDLNITLVEGAVVLNTDDESQQVDLVPGENANLKVGTSNLTVSKVNVDRYIVWRNGYFYFEKERLEDILLKLERWYDFKVFYQNQNVKDYVFRMRADRSHDFLEIVKRLELTGRISIEVNGNAIVIADVNR